MPCSTYSDPTEPTYNVVCDKGGSIEQRLELQIFVCAQPFNGYVGTVLPVQELSELGGTYGR